MRVQTQCTVLRNSYLCARRASVLYHVALLQAMHSMVVTWS